MVKELNKDNFKSEVLENEGTVLVDFWAPWCGPCKAMGPVVEELSNEMDIKCTKLDIDNAGEIAGEYEVMSIPTFIIFKNGKELNRGVGSMSKESLKKIILN